jgi:hypothetical protein
MAGTELIHNGGFEDGNIGWPTFSEGFAGIIKSNEAHSGGMLYKGKIGNLWQEPSKSIQGAYTPKLGYTYKLSCFYRRFNIPWGSNINSAPSLSIYRLVHKEYPGAGGYVASSVALGTTHVDNEWEYAETSFVVKENDYSVPYIGMRISNNGIDNPSVYLLDDISMLEIPPEKIPDEVKGDKVGTGILRLMNRNIGKVMGIKPIKNPPSGMNGDAGKHVVDADGGYIVYGDTNVVGQSNVVNILNVTYTAVSNNSAKSHDMGKNIYDIADGLYRDNEYDLLERPVLNGMNDDTDGSGLYTSSVLLQFAYIRGD